MYMMQDPAGRSMMVTSAATQLTPNTQRLGQDTIYVQNISGSVQCRCSPSLIPLLHPCPQPTTHDPHPPRT